jgi:hypothetical protein
VIQISVGMVWWTRIKTPPALSMLRRSRKSSTNWPPQDPIAFGLQLHRILASPCATPPLGRVLRRYGHGPGPGSPRCGPDRVHLHLEHPLVTRLLNRFLMRGFQSDLLSRAAVLGTNDDTAKLIVPARLSLDGHGPSRLHDEVLAVVAEWDPTDPNRRLRKLSEQKSRRALEDLEERLTICLGSIAACSLATSRHPESSAFVISSRTNTTGLMILWFGASSTNPCLR